MIAEEKWKLGEAKEVNENYVMLPLSDNNSEHSERNYLFVSKRTDERKWLLPNNEYMIKKVVILPHEINEREGGYEKEVQKEKQEVLAILYNIIKNAGSKHLKTIALSSPSGDRLAEVLEGVNTILGYVMVDSHTLLLLY